MQLFHLLWTGIFTDHIWVSGVILSRVSPFLRTWLIAFRRKRVTWIVGTALGIDSWTQDRRTTTSPHLGLHSLWKTRWSSLASMQLFHLLWMGIFTDHIWVRGIILSRASPTLRTWWIAFRRRRVAWIVGTELGIGSWTQDRRTTSHLGLHSLWKTRRSSLASMQLFHLLWMGIFTDHIWVNGVILSRVSPFLRTWWKAFRRKRVAWIVGTELGVGSWTQDRRTTTSHLGLHSLW